MVSFSTAVVVELLGSVTTVDGDIVKHILPFVDAGLQSGVKVCLDQQVSFQNIVLQLILLLFFSLFCNSIWYSFLSVSRPVH